MEKLYRFRKPKSFGKIQVMFKHIPGKWISTGTDDMATAVLWAEARLRKDIGAVENDTTLGLFAKDFYSKSDPYNIRARNASYNHNYDESYYQKRQGFLKNYILPRFGKQTITSLTDVTIEDWFLNLTKKDGSKLSDDSKNKILTTLEEVLQEARRRGIVSENQASKLGHIRVVSQKRENFTPEEMSKLFPSDDIKLLEIWGSLSWATYFLIFRDTGFRPGEVAALSIDSYIEKYHGLYSKKSVHFRTREVKDSIKTTGKGRDEKIGILTSQTERFLQQLIEIRKNEGRPFLFYSSEGQLIVPDTANKRFKDVADKLIDRKGRTQYSIRHSFETDLAGEVEDKVLLDLMAHTQYRKEYDHRTPERRLEQLQPVRDILEKRGGSQK